LVFGGASTVTATNRWKLGADFVAAAGRTLTVYWDGTNAQEVGRSTPSRYIRKVENLPDAATVTPNCVNDEGIIAALSQATNIANPTGSPFPTQSYVLKYKSVAAQTLTWGTQFRGSTDESLPVSTVAGKWVYVEFKWNSVDSTWDFMGSRAGF
jgi:hypothetical protein